MKTVASIWEKMTNGKLVIKGEEVPTHTPNTPSHSLAHNSSVLVMIAIVLCHCTRRRCEGRFQGRGSRSGGSGSGKGEVKGSCGGKGRWYPGTIPKSTGRTLCSDSAMDVRVKKAVAEAVLGQVAAAAQTGGGGGLREQTSLQWRSF